MLPWKKENSMNTFEILERKRRIVKIGKIVSIAVIIAAIGSVFWSILWAIGLALVGFVLALFTERCLTKPYIRAYKEQLVKDILSETIDDLTYNPIGGIKRDTIDSVGMMSIGNVYIVNDLIEGSYKGVRFSQSDIQIEQTYSDYNFSINPRNSHKTTNIPYLRGRWFVFDFPHKFNCNLQVRDRSFEHAKRPGGWLYSRIKSEKIKVKSEAFDRTFEVYATDESQALKFLTQGFMKAMLRAKKDSYGEVLFCFVGKKLHVAVNDKRDNFEPPVWSPIDREAARQSIEDDRDFITDLIDTLNLDERMIVEE